MTRRVAASKLIASPPPLSLSQMAKLTRQDFAESCIKYVQIVTEYLPIAVLKNFCVDFATFVIFVT